MDKIIVQQLPEYLKGNELQLKKALVFGGYQPDAVLRVEIPKPNSGVRKLGIPTVRGRFLQQAILQILQEDWEISFSESNFDFRPNWFVHDAIFQSQNYIKEDYRYVVDIYLETFFERVGHDRLMSKANKRITGKRVLRLIHKLLKASVMDNGIFERSNEGTP